MVAMEVNEGIPYNSHDTDCPDAHTTTLPLATLLRWSSSLSGTGGTICWPVEAGRRQVAGHQGKQAQLLRLCE